MKISEMTNDQAAEAMARLVEPFSNICDDEEMMAMIEEIKANSDTQILKMIPKMLPKLTAFALKKHKKDLYEVIGALQMVPTAKIGGMNFLETVGMVRASYDDILKSFFTQSKPVTETSEKESA